MPQQTNLNVSPYFDDFDATKNYHKVLFKPGYPVQARELTTLQSILQNQIEQFGNHIFKEGSAVIPGNINYSGYFYAVKIQNQYLGVDVNQYILDLVGKTIIGDTTKVEAKIVYALVENESNNEFATLYVNYLASGLNEQKVFNDEEKLILQETFTKDAIIIQSGEGFANTTVDCSAVGSAVILSSGIYFLRGNFVEVPDQTLILEPYSNTPSYKVGFDILEEVITSDEDDSLNDNAQGFSNYAAPGSDRFKISAILSKKDLTDTNFENFISLMEVRNGVPITKLVNKPEYNILADQMARRTYDESGNYFVKSFTIASRETLNDYLGNGGVFEPGQLTYNNNAPSEELGTYKISPGKAYVNGYEVETSSTIYLDFPKTRVTKTETNANLLYQTGSTYTLNRVYGAPNLNLGNPYIVSLRDQRVGITSSAAAGKEIGLARVYDYALESGSYDTSNLDLNRWDLSLFDIQTYTEIVVNEPITLTTPVHIKGKSTGATGYLRFNVNNVGIVTVYDIKGSFASGEKLIFNGIESVSRVSTAITEYTTKDVQSVSNVSGVTTVFTGDVIPASSYSVGIASITARSTSGISTVSISVGSNFSFLTNAKVGGLVGYTISGNSVPTYSRITSVSDKSVIVTGITTVTGVCEGSPPATASSVSDLSILKSNFQISADDTLYTPFPKSFVKSVDLTESHLTIKKEFAVSITSNQTNTITSDPNEYFLPFDEERYVLIRSNGVFETLTPDKFVFDSPSRQLTIYGLGANDTNARLIATLRKEKVTSKVKNKNRINTLIIDKSKNSASGIGSTTLNDGLTYGTYPYGTRVQDEEISLNVPDATILYAILESNDVNDPIAPAIVFNQLNGPTAKTSDLLVGEQFIGKTSKAVGIYVSKNNDLKIDFLYLNKNTFQAGELVSFKESGITATIQTVSLGSPNILKNYTFDSGQTDTIYNYSKVTRNINVKEPSRKLKFIFESASYLSSDLGDITVANSYDQFDYCFIPTIQRALLASDTLDIRPRVSNYTVSSGARSPFEFLSRTFSEANNSGKNVLASDESINLSYSYYLPRIDRIFLTKSGIFQLITGEPSENPQLPMGLEDALELANITIPPYLCNASAASISYIQHKRYQMRDISSLEDRIKNLEYYTSLNLLEVRTESTKITDSNGLDVFKSGFVVDNFTSTTLQNTSNLIKNSIDPANTELRPSPYTTEIDLLPGSKSLIGIGQSANPNVDIRFATDLDGNNIRRTGQLITLDYTDVEKITQPYATRSINVTPYLVTKYLGTIELSPSSDTWVDQVAIQPRSVLVDTYSTTLEQSIAQGWDPQTGYSPTVWGSWVNNWTGISVSTSLQTTNLGTTNSSSTSYSYTPHAAQVSVMGSEARAREQEARIVGAFGGREGQYSLGNPLYSQNITQTSSTTYANDLTTKVTLTGTKDRSGYFLKLSDVTTTESLGSSLVSNDFIHYMRSRNIQFIGKKFRPFTQVYGFFDGEDVNNFVFPKLLEISMISGVFAVGEPVLGVLPGTNLIGIRFRPAVANHRYGAFNSPTDVFIRNPYDQQNTATLPSVYSSTSTILNIDTTSLSEQSEGTFYGNIISGMKLYGLSSGAQAVVTNTRLVTDNVGTVIGSFFIPNPNVLSNPAFETGNKTFKLTSSPTNSQLDYVIETDAETNYFAQGLLSTSQETILSVRSPVYNLGGVTESVPISQTTTETNRSYSTITNTLTTSSTPPGRGFGNPMSSKNGGGGFGYRSIGAPTVRQCLNDPLAQSFYVDEIDGIFVTKVDLYFRSKDNTLPVTVELRTMSLGLPTVEVYPLSKVILDPKDINVSEDASVKTTVTFESPVYLRGQTEHALVLLSQSNDYNVWISRLGEVDVSTATGPESQQVIVTEQPTLGSLFKSQNASTWDASQYEDLKFTLYKAEFTLSGSVNFYNPELAIGNKQIANLLNNSLQLNSRTVRIGLGKTVTDTNLVIGNTIVQRNSNATGNYVGSAGSAFGTMTIINAGIGYSNGTYSNVSLTNVTGSGVNATANITIINNVATAATISTPGSGYRVGDVVTVSSLNGSTLGRNLRLSIPSLIGVNELIVDNVQGTFTTGTGSTIAFIAAGIGLTNLNSTTANVTASYVTVDSEEHDGLYVKVNHKNHGMNALNNDVIISGVESDSLPSFLTSDVANNSTSPIALSDMIVNPSTGLSVFNTFENVSVSSTNPGYVLIGQEIIAYEGISGNTLTGITREIDQTKAFSYTPGTPVLKYELDGISLRRINKTHTLQDAVDLDRPIDLDYYYLKVDTTQAGKTDSLPYGQVDRSVGTSFPLLYINETKSSGGSKIYATQNIPFEIIRPNIQTLALTGTLIKSSVRTISGSSIDGSEESYLDQGFEQIALDDNNYLPTPRIIASKVNETGKLSSLPGNKSFTMNLQLFTGNVDLSPVVDLDRVSIILASNRVNNPITNYITDSRISSIQEDPSAFVYATNPISLQVPASSIKIIVAAYVNQLSDLRALYAVMNSPSETPVYYPFPGYSNLTNLGTVIDYANSDGTPDAKVPKSDNFSIFLPDPEYKEYQFTANNLPEFKYFSIKLIGSSEDQAHPPRLKELRVIGLA